MEKETFEIEFREGLVCRLGPLGFQVRNSAFVLDDGLKTISLIRLGGKMAVPGAITQVLCFRHSFLRDRTETVPLLPHASPFDYPYKIQPSLARKFGSLVYVPQNLHFGHDAFHWSSLDRKTIVTWIDDLAEVIADHVLPWATSLSPRLAKSEIDTHGEDAWCERMWIDDYVSWLADHG